MISKDIVICDWHYKEAPPTASYFAIKGFDVISCSHQVPEVALQQVEEMQRVRAAQSGNISKHMLGVMNTCWKSANEFLDCYDQKSCSEQIAKVVTTFKTLFPEKK